MRPSRPLGVEPGAVRVRTFHALGREILRDAGVAVEPLADRAAVLAEPSLPWADEADLLRLDTAFSRLKVELGVDGRARSRRTPRPGRWPGRSCAYEAAVAAAADSTSTTWSSRAIAELEARPGPARPLARPVPGAARRRGPGRRPRPAPAGPAAGRPGEPGLPRRRRRPVDLRLATGRRAADPRRSRQLLPGLRRVDLEVNYRCPRPVVERAVRLIEHNEERFAKAIRAGPAASGRLVLAPDPSDETVRLERAIRTWPDDGSTRPSWPGRTVSCSRRSSSRSRLGLPFRAPRIELLARRPRGRRPARASGSERHAAGRCSSASAASARAAPTTRHRPGRCGPPRLGGRPPGPGGVQRRPSPRRVPGLADLRRDDARPDARDGPRDEGPRVRPRDRRRHGRRPFPERAGGQPRPTTRSGHRGGTASRLRRVDARAAFAHAASTTLRRRRRSCSRRSARTSSGSAPRPVELADEPVDRVEERLGQRLRAGRRGSSPSTP